MKKLRRCSIAIEAHEPRYERGALADLDEIFAHIAADNREAAGRLVVQIEDATARIAASPNLVGRTTMKSGFRRFPIGNNLVVYEVGKDEVAIHCVRHAARRRPWEGE
jgi:plasmid stabilization system protein ParE